MLSYFILPIEKVSLFMKQSSFFLQPTIELYGIFWLDIYANLL